ncbi:MAG: hypothetical protein WD060_11565 [Pirellulales bacterium]
MPPINRPLLRLALAMHADLTGKRPYERLLDLPSSAWQECDRTVRQLRRAQLRGWHLAADELRTNLRYELISIQSALAVIVAELPSPLGVATAATSGDLYEDLVALADEFPDLHFDRQAARLSVTTEPITLEGQYLGPFEIRLDWRGESRGDTPTYRVVALDPHPAESREGVTHPHVMDEVLCEGDGRLAIRGALAQGRLLDFFTIVANLLRTYNSASPFVELAVWHGSSCSDCGALVDDEECFTCQACHDSVCDGCEVVCSGCESCYCTGCTAACPDCDENYCRGCLDRCRGCRTARCKSCLDDHERCPNCHEEDESETIPDAASARPAVQPHGLGQAPVPA